MTVSGLPVWFAGLQVGLLLAVLGFDLRRSRITDIPGEAAWRRWRAAATLVATISLMLLHTRGFEGERGRLLLILFAIGCAGMFACSLPIRRLVRPRPPRP